MVLATQLSDSKNGNMPTVLQVQKPQEIIQYANKAADSVRAGPHSRSVGPQGAHLIGF